MDEILGQSRAIEVLQAALASGRLHHAFIFHGPPGVGKFTAAIAFAKVILCHDAQPDLTGRVAACGSCASCRLLTPAGPAHPDLHVVAKELALYSDERTVRERKLISIPVEVLTQYLIEPAYRAPALRHGKVFILDEAELLGAPGQNRLLKTLEEPPPGTHIVLVTSSEDRLLPTIRSRCQRVAFLPLADEIVGAWIDGRGGGEALQPFPPGGGQGEGSSLQLGTRNSELGSKQDRHPGPLPQKGEGVGPPALTPQQRQWAVDLAAGSLGRAKLALEFGLVDWAQRVLPAIDAMGRGRCDAELGAAMAAAIDDFAKRWVDAHENASKDAANKLGASLMWAMIAQHARRRLAEAAGKAPAGAEHADEAEAALSPWIGVIEAVTAAEAELAANVNPGVVTDHLVSVMQRALAPAAAVRPAV